MIFYCRFIRKGYHFLCGKGDEGGTFSVKSGISKGADHHYTRLCREPAWHLAVLASNTVRFNRLKVMKIFIEMKKY